MIFRWCTTLSFYVLRLPLQVRSWTRTFARQFAFCSAISLFYSAFLWNLYIYMNMTCKHSQRLWKYLQRRYWWPQCKKFHRSLFWSDFIFQDNFGVLNINAKKFFKKFTVFHGQISVWIVKFPSKTAKFCEQNATAYGHRCKKSCNILTYKNSNRLKKNRNPVFYLVKFGNSIDYFSIDDFRRTSDLWAMAMAKYNSLFVSIEWK